MGKAPRRKQIRAVREETTQSPASTSKKGKSVKEKDVLPLLKQLDAESSDERVWACASLSLLLSESDIQTRRLVGSHKVVDLLIGKANPSGAELDIGVRVEALGALRNYAVECGQEVCAEMFNKGLLPILLAYLPLLSTIIANLDASSQNGMQTDQPHDFDKQRQVVWDATENVLTLIWCLAESAPKSLPTLSSNDSLPSFLLNILSLHSSTAKLSPTLPTAVTLTALHTLSTLTESNPIFALPFLHLDLDALLSIAQSSPSAKDKRYSTKQLMRVLSISILLNIINCTSMPIPASMLSPIKDPKEERRLKKRNGLLADELKQALDFKALEALIQGLQVDLDTVTDEEEVQNIQIQLEVLGQFALTLDGLATVEEEDEWNGITEAEGSDAGMDEDLGDLEDAIPADIEMNGDNEQEEGPSSFISTSMGGVVKESNLVPLLLTLSTPSAPTANGHSDLISTARNATKSTLEQLRDLCRLRAMEALNNLLFTFTRAHIAASTSGSSTLLSAESLQSTWEALFRLLSTSLNDLSTDLKVAALGCIVACAQMGQNTLTIGQGETPFLLSLIGKDGEEDEVKARAMSVLALLGTRQGVSLQENETIGTTLLTPFKQPTADSFKANLPVLTQALDSLIDLYSDETRDFDQIFRGQGFLPILKKTLPLFKAAAKTVDRRKSSELRYRADAVATNLTAFVKYRESL